MFFNKRPNAGHDRETRPSRDMSGGDVQKTIAACCSGNRKAGDTQIRGWLAFFLWIGLGLGGTVTLVMMLKDILFGDYSFFFIFLRSATTLLLVFIAAYAIHAFYRRLPDAVAAARTYIVMVVIDGALGLFFALAYDDPLRGSMVLRQFVWGLVWSLYLNRSVRVRELFPPAKRRWGVVEKFSLITFSAGYLTVLLMALAQSSTNVLLSSQGYIRQTVDATQAELPVDMGDHVQLVALRYRDNSIRYEFRLSDVERSELDVENLPAFVEECKQEMLDEWAATMVSDEFMAYCCRERLIIVYEYYDCAGEYIFRIVITPDEYKDRMYELGVEADEELWN